MVMNYTILLWFSALLSLANLTFCQVLRDRSKRHGRPIRNRAIDNDAVTLPLLDRVPDVEDSIFLQIDNVIYFRSQKSDIQLKACCDSDLRGGMSAMVNQITRDMGYVIDAQTHYFFLKLKNDCVKINPRYDMEVRFTASIEMQNTTDTKMAEQELRDRIKVYVDEGDLDTYFWRNDFNDAQSLSTGYSKCDIKTASPSGIPTVITASPSIPKPPGAVSILFQVGLAGGKTAKETNECCRQQIITSAKKSMSKILGGLSGRRLELSSPKEAYHTTDTSQHLDVTRWLPEDVEEPEIFCDVESLTDDPDCSCVKIDVDCQVNFPEDTNTQETEGKMNVALENQAESGELTEILNEEGVEGEAVVVIKTRQPSFSPSISPTQRPSHSPSDFPTNVPSVSLLPTVFPSQIPTNKPSHIPTNIPSEYPSTTPTIRPSRRPTSKDDMRIPSSTPSEKPSNIPSISPSFIPSGLHSTSPSLIPSVKPSLSHSTTPSVVPSITPSKNPSSSPTDLPSIYPSLYPSLSPIITPSMTPSTSMSPSPLPSYYLACGSSAGCRSGPIQAYPEEKHELRCCADENLGGGWRKNTRCNVWGESEMEGKCFHSVDYAEAVNICERNGARLCTKEELEDNCTQGTGCNHDYDMIWTSTRFPAS